MKASRILAAILLTAAVASAFAAEKPAPRTEKVSGLFQYSGYTFEEYKGYKKISDYVPMSDGVKLAVDVFIPDQGPEQKAFPVIIEYTPYTRAYADLKNGPLHQAVRKAVLKTSSPIVDVMNAGDMAKPLRVLVAHGYVFNRRLRGLLHLS